MIGLQNTGANTHTLGLHRAQKAQDAPGQPSPLFQPSTLLKAVYAACVYIRSFISETVF